MQNFSLSSFLSNRICFLICSNLSPILLFSSSLALENSMFLQSCSSITLMILSSTTWIGKQVLSRILAEDIGSEQSPCRTVVSLMSVRPPKASRNAPPPESWFIKLGKNYLRIQLHTCMDETASKIQHLTYNTIHKICIYSCVRTDVVID